MKGKELSPVKIYSQSDEDKQNTSKEDQIQQEKNISSPTKTIKSILRMSIYSSNSTSSEISTSIKSSINMNKEVISPTKNKIGVFFKPKLNISRSSFTTNNSNTSISKSINASIISIQRSEQRRTTLDDFADTSTDTSKNNSDYDIDSFNSILKEYEEENERNDFVFKEEFDETKSVNNLSKITIDESSINETKHDLKKINTENSSRRSILNKSIIELTLDDVKLSSSSSSSPHSYHDAFSESPRSSKFEIYQDKKDKIKIKIQDNKSKRISSLKKHKKKVLSASSNIDILNRSSLYNSTTTSDSTQKSKEGNVEGKYPDPNISLTNTPKWSGNTSSEADVESSSVRMSYTGQSISERPLHTVIIDESFDMDETILKDDMFGDDINDSKNNKYNYSAYKSNKNNPNIRKSIATSLSSGELLSKLETFQEIQEQDDILDIDSRFINNSSSRENINVAHKLPMNKVYEKLHSSDESSIGNSDVQKRLGVKKIIIGPSRPTSPEIPQLAHLALSDIGDQALSNLLISNTQKPLFNVQPSPAISSSKKSAEENFNQNLDDFRHNRPWSLASPNLSVSKPRSNIRLSDNLTKKNSHEYLLENAPKPSYLEPVSSGSIYCIGDVEKNLINNKIPSRPIYYSWLTLIGFMLLSLIIPPLFFLLSLGFCDNFNRLPHYYNGIIPWSQFSKNYSVKNSIHFSRTQKIFSFAVGVVWLAIIIAMIIVGICVGISSVS